MTYWAKIENNVVVDVIIADQSYIARLPGTWLETDPNTHGNIHYGEDGQPDGGVPLRKNYGGIGSGYAPQVDGFHAIDPPGPSDLWVLNPETLVWEYPTD